uniref:Uncharacterized protein n=1 Tax=Anguilla anguilla TaxID=7936 RepID=A0A0E9TCV5_ANGAN
MDINQAPNQANCAAANLFSVDISNTQHETTIKFVPRLVF